MSMQDLFELSEESAFRPDDLGMEVFQRSYAIDAEETWEMASYRVAEHVAAAEDSPVRKKWQLRFQREIVSNRFMPGGRIWYGSGRPKAQLLNCFVIPVSDSREGWGEMLKQSLIISGTGGGVGINFSPVRPNGAEIKGTGGVATGPVSLMRMDNSIGHELVAGGGRRMAKMSCLNINHPDVVEFLNSKLEDGQLSNTNISVVLNFDPEEFKRLVLEDGEIELEWGGQKKGTVPARELWEKIVQNAWKNGEPGVLNGFYANKMNNIYYYKNLVSTNPCGEIWLEPYGCCDLGALVLPRFVRGGSIDWALLEHTIRCGVRFLDDVLTVNQYPLPEIKDNCEQVRRIGLGVMGLHTMLLQLGLKYSSAQAMQFVDQLFSFIKNSAYDTSINLAIEKGPFPAFSHEMADSGFMKTVKPAIRRKVEEYGIRNCALLTVAPTGTTGMVCGTSTGIEPYMAPVYWRRIKTVDDKNKTVIDKVLVIEPAYEDYTDVIEGAADIPVEKHFEMQQVVQKHVDNAVSKTINLPNDYDAADLSRVWLDNISTLKGTTFYRWGSRENEPFEPVLLADIEDVVAETPEAQIRRKERSEEKSAMEGCISGVCEVPQRVAA
jgi:ribonucleoside-diphosphate reductase alpha chain